MKIFAKDKEIVKKIDGKIIETIDVQWLRHLLQLLSSLSDPKYHSYNIGFSACILENNLNIFYSGGIYILDDYFNSLAYISFNRFMEDDEQTNDFQKVLKVMNKLNLKE